MIAQKHKKHQQWQQELIGAISSVPELLEFCNLEAQQTNYDAKAHDHFKFFITKSWAERIEKGNPKDPLLLQILPAKQELEKSYNYQNDPLEEQHQSPTNGIIHKYHGRVLLTLTGQCAIYCRYCFRRNYPYSSNSFNQINWLNAVTYLTKNQDIYEVILSGGDPLMLPDKILKQIVTTIADLPHIKYLRIHSRMPSVLPSRISASLIEAITHSKLKTTIVNHINHPNEIVAEVSNKFALLSQHNILLLNQSVMLANINDSAPTLAALSHKLYEANCLPYYLHRLDKVEGSKHFEVSPLKEQTIMRELLATLSGYLVPKLVTEQPYKAAKTPINIDF
jgi:L-lysine 2,3-aminomutase